MAGQKTEECHGRTENERRNVMAGQKTKGGMSWQDRKRKRNVMAGQKTKGGM